jgi:hypothetical protein
MALGTLVVAVTTASAFWQAARSAFCAHALRTETTIAIVDNRKVKYRIVESFRFSPNDYDKSG